MLDNTGKPAELIAWLIDVCSCLCVCNAKLLQIVLLQFLSDSHKTWHTWSMCQCRNTEQTFETL